MVVVVLFEEDTVFKFENKIGKLKNKTKQSSANHIQTGVKKSEMFVALGFCLSLMLGYWFFFY